MSVWVEIRIFGWSSLYSAVTLHVSVWVEIHLILFFISFTYVTLHVSVWVEIWNMWQKNAVWKSRSTWACELKFVVTTRLLHLSCHAPRERVSWNDICLCDKGIDLCHAPRERVSWNLKPESLSETLECHAPRERVSWNMLVITYFGKKCSHAPRERVSWNYPG